MWNKFSINKKTDKSKLTRKMYKFALVLYRAKINL